MSVNVRHGWDDLKAHPLLAGEGTTALITTMPFDTHIFCTYAEEAGATSRSAPRKQRSDVDHPTFRVPRVLGYMD